MSRPDGQVRSLILVVGGHGNDPTTTGPTRDTGDELCPDEVVDLGPTSGSEPFVAEKGVDKHYHVVVTLRLGVTKSDNSKPLSNIVLLENLDTQ